MAIVILIIKVPTFYYLQKLSQFINKLINVRVTTNPRIKERSGLTGVMDHINRAIKPIIRHIHKNRLKAFITYPVKAQMRLAHNLHIYLD